VLAVYGVVAYHIVGIGTRVRTRTINVSVISCTGT